MLQNWSWTVEHNCAFEYVWFPFDTQSCYMHTKILGQNIRMRLLKVIYTGSTDLGRYYFREMRYCQVDKNGRSGLFVNFIFSRPLTSNILTIFLPTAMLLLISLMVVIFRNTYLDMVIDVNATLILVLTT